MNQSNNSNTQFSSNQARENLTKQRTVAFARNSDLDNLYKEKPVQQQQVPAQNQFEDPWKCGICGMLFLIHDPKARQCKNCGESSNFCTKHVNEYVVGPPCRLCSQPLWNSSEYLEQTEIADAKMDYAADHLEERLMEDVPYQEDQQQINDPFDIKNIMDREFNEYIERNSCYYCSAIFYDEQSCKELDDKKFYWVNHILNECKHTQLSLTHNEDPQQYEKLLQNIQEIIKKYNQRQLKAQQSVIEIQMLELTQKYYRERTQSLWQYLFLVLIAAIVYFSTNINEFYQQHKSQISHINIFGEVPYNLQSAMEEFDNFNFFDHHGHNDEKMNMQQTYEGLIKFYEKFGNKSEHIYDIDGKPRYKQLYITLQKDQEKIQKLAEQIKQLRETKDKTHDEFSGKLSNIYEIFRRAISYTHILSEIHDK